MHDDHLPLPRHAATAAALLLCAMASACAQTAWAHTGGGPLHDPALGEADKAAARAAGRAEAFASLDRNGDGAISRAEASGPVAEQFEALDANLNGSLDYAEFLGFRPER